MADIDVSNVYVQLGNEFNSAVSAFNSYHIDMRCVFFIVHVSFLLQGFDASDAVCLGTSNTFLKLYVKSSKPRYQTMPAPPSSKSTSRKSARSSPNCSPD